MVLRDVGEGALLLLEAVGRGEVLCLEPGKKLMTEGDVRSTAESRGRSVDAGRPFDVEDPRLILRDSGGSAWAGGYGWVKERFKESFGADRMMGEESWRSRQPSFW
jgi:hypothetical protein